MFGFKKGKTSPRYPNGIVSMEAVRLVQSLRDKEGDGEVKVVKGIRGLTSGGTIGFRDGLPMTPESLREEVDALKKGELLRVHSEDGVENAKT